MNRRLFLKGMTAACLAGVAVSGVWPERGFGADCLNGMPEALRRNSLMAQIWDGIDPSNVWDSHVHLTGTGDSQAGVWMNPAMNSWRHPVLRVQKVFYINGSCSVPDNVDISYVQRLAMLAAEMPPGFKSMLFAFDWFHDERGEPLEDKSIFHISNEYAAKVSREYPEYFEWVASIHPYRPDAVDVLEAAKSQGARAIKWLPSGMGIDPASPKCDAFYKKAAELNIPIISHTGRESAVQGGDQRHGNPLRMRRALDHGVRVVLAHCASDGDDEDLDNGNKRIKSIELFARLMDSPDYKHLVYGEISALTLINHVWAIPYILSRDDWQSRLLNGSDYPLPGIFPLVNTEQLARNDLLDEAHVPFLQELKSYNPLMFDFALKRLIRYQGKRFAPRAFETRMFFTSLPITKT